MIKRVSAVLSVLVTSVLLAGPAAAAEPAPASMVIAPGPQVFTMVDPAPPPPALLAKPPLSKQVAAAAAEPVLSTWQVNYDSGFNANPSAKAAFQAAVDIWSRRVASRVPIVVDAMFTPQASGVLGAAGPTVVAENYPGAPRLQTFYAIALANARAGVDLVPTASDITAQFNSTFTRYYFGTDGNPPMTAFDFESVVLHELGHGLGFVDSTDYDSSTGQGFYGVVIDSTTGLRGDPLIYDRLVRSDAGVVLTQMANGSTALGMFLTAGAGTVRQFGTRVTGCNNGATVPLFAPSPYQPGSSIAHYDENSFPATSGNALMTPSLAAGEAEHEPGLLMLCHFEDQGWVTSLSTAAPPAVVPEVPLPALLPLVGVGVVGLVAVRRRRLAAA